MNAGVHVAGQSPLHRMRPGVKLLLLVVLSTALMLVRDIAILALGLMATLALFPLAGLPLSLAWRQLRPVLPIIMLIVLVQWASGEAVGAVAVALRLPMLVLLAALVSLTTRASAMIETLAWAAQPLAYLGISPTRMGLTLSLALRFIPLIAAELDEVRAAQRARGLERGVVAPVIPLVVRVLKMATEVGDAIEARSFDPDDAKRFRDSKPRRRDDGM